MPPSAFRTLRPLILASGSPRRRAFLESMGIPFSVVPAANPEPRPLPDESPREYTCRAAEAKARAVFAGVREDPGRPAVLAADTSVVLSLENGSEILGKPRSKSDALAMLSRLCGRSHHVITACCLAMDDRVETFDDVTEVSFAQWPLAVLEAYVESGDPMDKAGAYGIQEGGAFLVSGIRGSWSTVVGLPLDIVLMRLIHAGVLKVNL